MVLAHMCFLLFIGVAFANIECGKIDSGGMHTFHEDNKKFAMDMYKHMKETEKGNIVYSPMSISMALGMVMGGAKGKTLEQIKNVLAKSLMAKEIGPAYSKCMGTVKVIPKHANFSMYIANAMYVQKGMAMLPKFIEHVKMCMSGEAMERDFKTKSKEIRVEVNKYVSDKTHEMIKNLLPEGSVDDMTRMILVNTMYMKVAWMSTFQKENTKKDTFHSKEGKQTVEFMNQQNDFNFMEDDNMQTLQMKYVGDSMSMFVMLPKDKDKKESLMHNDIESMMEKMESMKLHSVTVKIPKFKVKLSMQPKEILTKMGMTDMFSSACDLSGMSKAKLVVSEVFHEAVVEANEVGTEASAATAIVMMTLSARPQYPKATFTADRPFMFMIYHRDAKSILFVGSVLTLK